MYNNLHHKLSVCFKQFLLKILIFTIIILEQKKMFNFLAENFKFLKFGIKFNDPRLWNMLPSNVKNSDSIYIFKDILKNLLCTINHC